MKNILVSVLLFAAVPVGSYEEKMLKAPTHALPVCENLVLVTIDGFRWQEVFEGADSVLLADEDYTAGASLMQLQYWGPDPQERRKKLLPFFWNIIAAQGQLYGNRNLGSKINTANLYAMSYPGYSEIFTGLADINISSNRKRNNPNLNLMEWLDSKPGFHGKVAAFTSWDVFPYILNTERNNLTVNSGYSPGRSNASAHQQIINAVQDEMEEAATRYDELTYLSAREYARQHHPRVLFIGLGETDEFAHQQRYDLYLEQANKVDRMLGELWRWIQTTPGYKDHTTLIITTDHGRGSKRNRWSSHGEFIKGSSQTWLAIIGPGIKPLGEINDKHQLYQEQLAQTMANLLGEEFHPGEIAPAISLR